MHDSPWDRSAQKRGNKRGKMVTLNIPLFLGPKAVCEILDCSAGEVRMLLDTGKLSGGRTINGLKVSTESVCLLLGQKELMKKSYLWLKSGK